MPFPLQKLLRVLLGLGCHPLDFCQHNLVQCHDLGVGRTLILVLVVSTTDVGILFFIPASAAAEVVLRSAGFAFHQAGKHILLSHLVESALALTHLLHDVPCLPVNQRLMCILKAQPLFRRIFP